MDEFLNLGLLGAFRDVSKNAKMVAAMRRNGARLCKAFVSIGWPPPWHLPARQVDLLARAVLEEGLVAQELEDMVIQLYDEQLLMGVFAEWRSKKFLSDRLPILEEAIASYIDGRYYAAVCTLLPQIEGVMGDYLGRTPNAQNDAQQLFRDSGLSQAALDFYVRFVNENFIWTGSPPRSSRHAILHGQDTRFGTPGTALKFLLTFDAVQAGIGDRFAQSHDGLP